MVIKNAVDTYVSIEECKDALVTLNNLRDNAFQQLIAEKLSADASFQIFLNLLEDTHKDIINKINLIKSQNE